MSDAQRVPACSVHIKGSHSAAPMVKKNAFAVGDVCNFKGATALIEVKRVW